MPTRLALALAAALILQACSPGSLFGGNTERPKGPGSATDELRVSPCACMELPNAAPDATILEELRREFGA